MTNQTRIPDLTFWSGRRVFVTGHSGFKGAWLTAWLTEMGASVLGVSLPDLAFESRLWPLLHLDTVTDVRADIAGRSWQEQAVKFDPHVVFHLAAQALVPEGYARPMRTFESNVLGTARLMDVLHQLPSLEATLVITTDKVYDTRQAPPFAEDTYLGGRDPYSASKAAAELVVQSWPTDGLAVATARAGNVIGGGDWAADRLLPDLERAWTKGEALRLRRPRSVRPWQHVLEPLNGYLLYAESLAEKQAAATALNFGPGADQCVPVDELVEFAADHWSQEAGERPSWEAMNSPPIHETDALLLDSGSAERELSWTNLLGWRDSVAMTLDGYRELRLGTPPIDVLRLQLADYLARAKRGEP